MAITKTPEGRYVCETHGDVTDNTAWVRCYAGCDEGHFDAYEDDPLMNDPGDLETCRECSGKGGFVVCGQCNLSNPDAEV